MINLILGHFASGRGTVLPKWQQALSTVQRSLLIDKRKYLRADKPMGTPFQQLLHNILFNVDVASFLTQDDDMALYNALSLEHDRLSKLFDPVYLKDYMVGGLFENKNDLPIEVLIDGSYTLPLTRLPLGKPWTAWNMAEIRPVRILHHDSASLDIDFVSCQIKSKKQAPNYALICINPVTLCLTYIKYLQSLDTPNPMMVLGNVHDFIRQHLLYDVYTDMVNIWTVNVWNSFFAADDLHKTILDQASITPQTGASLQSAEREILATVNKCKRGNMRIQDFMATDISASGSIIDIINGITDNHEMPMDRQHAMYAMIAVFPYLKLIRTIGSAFPTMDYQNYTKDYDRFARMVKRRGLYSITNSKLKTLLEFELDDI